MTVSTSDKLLGLYNSGRAIGSKSINSDAYFEIEGFEHLGLLTKQFPWPYTGVAGEIEVPGPLGSLSYMPQQLKTNHQGQLSFTETTAGHVRAFLEQVIVKNGGVFQAKVYEGTPDQFSKGCKIRDCFFQPDDTDRDWENRSQLTAVAGTLFFHFYNEMLVPNSPGTIGAV